MRLYGKERGVRGHARHERQPARRGKRKGRPGAAVGVCMVCGGRRGGPLRAVGCAALRLGRLADSWS